MYCRICDVHGPHGTSSRISYHFKTDSASDFLWCGASSTGRHNADCEPVYNRILPAYPVLFVGGDLTPFPTIRAKARLWLCEPQPSEVQGLEVPSVVLKAAECDPYAADVKAEGDRMFLTSMVVRTWVVVLSLC